MLPLVHSYIVHHFALQEGGIYTHWAIMGLWLVSAAFQTFIFVATIRALWVVLPRRPRTRPSTSVEPVFGRGNAADGRE